MKKMLCWGLLLFTLASCSQLEDLLKPFQKEEKDTACPTVTSEKVPAEVSASFSGQYPNATPGVWCTTDKGDYVAVFMLDSLETKAFFDSNGVFLKEATEADQQGNHEDKNNGCECELPEDQGDSD